MARAEDPLHFRPGGWFTLFTLVFRDLKGLCARSEEASATQGGERSESPCVALASSPGLPPLLYAFAHFFRLLRGLFSGTIFFARSSRVPRTIAPYWIAHLPSLNSSRPMVSPRSVSLKKNSIPFQLNSPLLCTFRVANLLSYSGSWTRPVYFFSETW